MQYEYKPRALKKIWAFYRNVAKKYRHAYDLNDMERDISHAVFDGTLIEKTLHRRPPTLNRWQGWHMATNGRWFYAYTIEGDTITIQDACHSQNMH